MTGIVHILYIYSTLSSSYQCNSVIRSQFLPIENPRIGIIGTGYVGLVTGACLAECGNTVICTDIDNVKINLLKKNIIPIYEPDLETLVIRNIEQERLLFSNDIEQTIYDADIIFIAVGTPAADNGSVNLNALYQVIDSIGKTIHKHLVIVIKSTVPVGTGARIRTYLENVHNIDPDLFCIVSNPEFLREGSAVHDFLEPDRLVIGIELDTSYDALYMIYKSILTSGVPCIVTNIATAELIKYACNAFLATKLSFINEIANICDATGAQVHTIAYAMGLDHRISPYFLKAGPGYGGCCFPKDTQALVHMARHYQVPMHTVQGAIDTNSTQHKVPVNKLLKIFNGEVNGKVIAILGLAFKANTDDIRCSPSILVIKQLQDLGATITAYDPKAMYTTAQLFPTVRYCSCAYEAVTDADAILIMTEWEEFRHLNLKRIASLVRQPIIIDARNILDSDQVYKHGFIYDGIGLGIIHESV